MKINLDLSSFEEFLKTVEILKKGKNPEKEQWKVLFSTPGYEALVKEEYRKDFFIKSFNLVFKPSLQEKLKELLGSNIGRLLRHYLRVRDNLDEIVTSVKNIKEKWLDISEQAILKAKTILPERLTNHSIDVSIAIFDLDARGYETIVIDPIFALREEDFIRLLAHELFHVHHNNVLAYQRKTVDENYKSLMWLLHQIQSEGIADLIDKDYFIFSNEETLFPKQYVERFKVGVNNASTTIKNINRILENKLEDKINFKLLGEKLKAEVPLSGHPLGYFMAKTIIEAGAKDRMIEELSTPFQFFTQFNEIVKQKKLETTIYSDQFISMLNELNKKISP